MSEPHALARYARDCIRAALGGPLPERPGGEAMERHCAVFVSLHWPDGELQGCIGTIEPRGPLVDAVKNSARSAAFHDPRGRRLTLADTDDLTVELSVLSPLEPVPFTDEASACAALRVGIDGVVLRYRGQQATFLPQMWPRLVTAANLLDELKQKAGFAGDFWSPEIELFRYTVTLYTDPPPPRPPR